MNKETIKALMSAYSKEDLLAAAIALQTKEEAENEGIEVNDEDLAEIGMDATVERGSYMYEAISDFIQESI